MNTKKRLAEIRKKIMKQNISYGEILELQEMAEHIDKNDTILLEWAAVPECFGNDE